MAERLRILHLISTVNPTIGGPREGVAQMGGQLSALGHRVEVASCCDRPHDPWVKEFPLTVHGLGPAFLRYGYSHRLAPWIQSNIDRFDAIIINGLWQYHGFGAYSELRRRHKPYFVFTHGMLDPWSRKAHPAKYLKKLLYWTAFEYRLLRNASAVFFTSDEECRLARQYFPFCRWKEVVVGYGISPPDLNEERQAERVFSAFPQLKGKRLILSLSRIHEKKGIDILIHAFSQVCTMDADLHLLIAGSGEARYEQRLKALVASLGLTERVTWTGLIRDDLKWGAFHLADLYVLPSHQENFGLSVAEALACSTPVLITNKVNIWREIEEHRAGLVCNDDVKSLVQTMRKWIGFHANERESFRRRALECYQRCFSARMPADNIRMAIESVLK